MIGRDPNRRKTYRLRVVRYDGYGQPVPEPQTFRLWAGETQTAVLHGQPSALAFHVEAAKRSGRFRVRVEASPLPPPRPPPALALGEAPVVRFHRRFWRIVRENKLIVFSLLAFLGYGALLVGAALGGWLIEEGVLKPVGFASVLFWMTGPLVWFFLNYLLESDPDERARIGRWQRRLSAYWVLALAAALAPLIAELYIL